MKFFTDLLNEDDLPVSVSGVSQVRKLESPLRSPACPGLEHSHTDTPRIDERVRDALNEDVQANHKTNELSHLSHASLLVADECLKTSNAEPSDAIQPWNPELIYHALRTGRFVRIWSRTLNGWCVWVRDDGVKAMASRRYPDTPVFTLAELKTLTASRCPPEHLRGIAHTRAVFGNTCPIHVDRLQTEPKEIQ